MSSESGNPVIQIRKMAPTDLEQVIEIDQMSFSQPWPKNSFQFEMYNNPVSRLWVAEKLVDAAPACIVGMMVTWLVIDEAHIGTLAIRPDYRRMGIGTRLMHHGLAQLKAEGANLIYLEVRRSNLSAQELYKRFGFYMFDERKGYYQDNKEDALIYILDNLQTRNFSTNSQNIK